MSDGNINPILIRHCERSEAICYMKREMIFDRLPRRPDNIGTPRNDGILLVFRNKLVPT